MARRGKGSYAPLKAQYYLDDAILEAGPDAELLWVRILSFLASVRSDGRITDRQLKSVGFGLRNVKRRIEKLQEVGLLLQDGDSYEARSWHKWNRSSQEIDNYLASERERKRLKAAENADNSARNEGAFRPDSALSTVQYSPVQLEVSKDTSLSDSIESNQDGAFLASDWVPAAKQYDHAKSLGLNPENELQRFRDHAHRTQRRQKNWNTAFTNWLKKAAEFNQQRQTAGQAGFVQPQRQQTAVDKARAIAANMSGTFGGKEIEA